MPRFAANLTMMFTERPFLERFKAAAESGFHWVEYLSPYEHAPEELATALKKYDLAQALFNLPPGNWEAGERGLACLAGREAEFEASLEKGIAYAKALGCPRLHLMAGNRPSDVPFESMEQTYLAHVRQAARRLAGEGLQLCLEPINHYSMPDYFLRTQEQGAAYIAALGMENVKLQFDFFHCQMEQGNVAGRLKEFFPFIGHCQLAGVPERHEPDTGELDYGYLLPLLDRLGYEGVVGCEYNPAGKTEDGLGWLHAFA